MNLPEKEASNFFLVKSSQKPVIGFTTGTCAACAARAAACVLAGKKCPSYVSVATPAGIVAVMEILSVQADGEKVTCCVQKNSGTDPDVTDGVFVFATLEFCESSEIVIEGGVGVGTVTLPGLDQKVGMAAINSVPRKMIADAVASELGKKSGIKVTVSIPQGLELAEKTFNPKMGIVGGISVLGTSGIVEPMSEDALVKTISLEINVRRELKWPVLAVVPGNYGTAFMKSEYDFSIDTAVTCSNFVYDTVTMALNSGFDKMLFAGHVGKLIKVSGGVKNTHSKYGDRRMEIFSSFFKEEAAKNKMDPALVEKYCCDLEKCVSMDEAINIVKQTDVYGNVMKNITLSIKNVMESWGQNRLAVEVVMFSNVHGVLGITDGAENYMAALKNFVTAMESTGT